MLRFRAIWAKGTLLVWVHNGSPPTKIMDTPPPPTTQNGIAHLV